MRKLKGIITPCIAWLAKEQVTVGIVRELKKKKE